MWAVVDELSLRPDDQVIASRGVGAWLAANTMLQVRDGRRSPRWVRLCGRFRRWLLGSIAGIVRFDHAVLIVEFL